MRRVDIDCGPARLPLAWLEGAGEQALRADLERIGCFDRVRVSP